MLGNGEHVLLKNPLAVAAYSSWSQNAMRSTIPLSLLGPISCPGLCVVIPTAPLLTEGEGCNLRQNLAWQLEFGFIVLLMQELGKTPAPFCGCAAFLVSGSQADTHGEQVRARTV